MISTENIASKIQKLPPASQKQVIDLIDSLLEKPVELTPSERAELWREFAKSHADNRVVILDDSREAIYED